MDNQPPEWPTWWKPAVLEIYGTKENPIFKLNGAEIPVVELKTLVPPRTPVHTLHAIGGGAPYQYVGRVEYGMVTITVVVGQLILAPEMPVPEPQAYRREGLDL